MRVIFRFKPDDEKAWVGFAEGRTWEDIADVIDEFGDPNSADIVILPKTYPMGFCIPFTNDEEEGWDSVDEGREVSGWFFEYDVDDPRWETERVSLEELEAFG